MAEENYLDGKQMSGAFQLLRSNDLVWSAAVQEYLMGERQPMIDLMAWNADTTRMPYRMHSEYLRRFFLTNDLAEGRYEAGGKVVSLRDIHAPVFAVSTITDHVAPWRSVYKIQILTDADVTFVLFQWRPQCRHCESAWPSQPPSPDRHPQGERDLYRSRCLAGFGHPYGGVLVAMLARLARPPFQYKGPAAAHGSAGEGLCAFGRCARNVCP
jgi:hypothetical protein